MDEVTLHAKWVRDSNIGSTHLMTLLSWSLLYTQDNLMPDHVVLFFSGQVMNLTKYLDIHPDKPPCVITAMEVHTELYFAKKLLKDVAGTLLQLYSAGLTYGKLTLDNIYVDTKNIRSMLGTLDPKLHNVSLMDDCFAFGLILYSIYTRTDGAACFGNINNIDPAMYAQTLLQMEKELRSSIGNLDAVYANCLIDSFKRCMAIEDPLTRLNGLCLFLDPTQRVTLKSYVRKYWAAEKVKQALRQPTP
jgi:hypothetical protein